MDPRRLQRFHNEAQAAACLHHTNIVPVHAVGSERGVHYYAMQFIDGQTLAEAIRQMRQAGEAPVGEAGGATTEPAAKQSTLTTARGKPDCGYFRRVAELGVQAAEALDHAHQMGIVHRDVKPGNLLVDGRGNLWVTDFGLAQVQQGEGSLTMTGDLVGTLRYMSPEQALAKRVILDHRTDVYSLGATLYELLTLRPAFDGQDRQELLRQIAFEEPLAPRKLDRDIPPELETIVLKALEKNPAQRYGTAQELADDLQRWLKNEPIQARRPSLWQVVVKWARRHRAFVWAVVTVLLMAAVVSGASGLWWAQKRAGAQGEARAELQEAIRLQGQQKWTEALGAIRRANGALTNVWADPALREQVKQRGKDLQMALLLQEARLQGAAVKDGHFDHDAVSQAYADAFAWYDLAVDELDPQDAGERIQARSIQAHLVAALDEWAYLRARQRRGWRHLLAVSQVVDPAPWRDRLRDVLERPTLKGLKELAACVQGNDVALTKVVLLAKLARGTKEAEQTVAVLKRLQQRHPDDFWANHELGFCLARLQPPRLEEAIRYYIAAVALRPHSPGARLNLGIAFSDKGLYDEAIAELHEAIRLKPNYAEAHSNLGTALGRQGKHGEAEAAYRQAIALKPDYALAHSNLGYALANQGKHGEAEAAYRQAIALKPDHAPTHTNLGNALFNQGKAAEAEEAHRQAIALKPDLAEAHFNLALQRRFGNRMIGSPGGKTP
jgi:Flp pilus assembly protein TadD